jgi:hypothetical protein
MKNCFSERKNLIPDCRLLWRTELFLDSCGLLLLVWLVAGCSATKPYEVREAVGPNQPLSARKKTTEIALPPGSCKVDARATNLGKPNENGLI